MDMVVILGICIVRQDIVAIHLVVITGGMEHIVVRMDLIMAMAIAMDMAVIREGSIIEPKASNTQ